MKPRCGCPDDRLQHIVGPIFHERCQIRSKIPVSIESLIADSPKPPSVPKGFSRFSNMPQVSLLSRTLCSKDPQVKGLCVYNPNQGPLVRSFHLESFKHRIYAHDCLARAHTCKDPTMAVRSRAPASPRGCAEAAARAGARRGGKPEQLPISWSHSTNITI